MLLLLLQSSYQSPIQKRFHFPDSICLLPLLRTHSHCFKKRLMATALKEVDCNSSERMVVPHCRWLGLRESGGYRKAIKYPFPRANRSPGGAAILLGAFWYLGIAYYALKTQ